MIDLKSVLHRVGERIAAREDAFERLSERRGRKRRNQRISAGVVAVLVAVAGGVGVWAGFRNGTIVPPAGEDAENAQVVALWPERTLSEIEAAEQRVVSGEDPWRLESESTAVRFASEVLGWSDPTVSIQIVPGPVDAAVAEVTTPPAPCPAPPEGEPISLTCLGKRAEVFLHGFTGPGGIWSVTWVGGDRTRVDLDPPFAVSPGQVVEAHVDVPEGAQAIGGGSFFGDGCQASFGSERVTETGKIDLIVPPGDCLEGAAGEVSDGYLYVYVVGSGPAWDPDPTDTEELLAEDPLGGRSVDPMDLTLIRVHLASDTSPQPVEQTEIPDVAEVNCNPAASVPYQSNVRPQPDGVHLRIHNGLDHPIRVDVEGQEPDSFRADPGVTETVRSYPPGPLTVVCSDDGFVVASDLQIVDTEGLWTSTELQCGEDDVVAAGTGDGFLVVGTADPVALVREIYPKLLDDDVVELAGYPSATPPIVRVVREGRVAAVAQFRSDGQGGWLLSGDESCGIDLT